MSTSISISNANLLPMRQHLEGILSKEGIIVKSGTKTPFYIAAKETEIIDECFYSSPEVRFDVYFGTNDKKMILKNIKKGMPRSISTSIEKECLYVGYQWTPDNTVNGVTNVCYRIIRRNIVKLFTNYLLLSYPVNRYKNYINDMESDQPFIDSLSVSTGKGKEQDLFLLSRSEEIGHFVGAAIQSDDSPVYERIVEEAERLTNKFLVGEYKEKFVNLSFFNRMNCPMELVIGQRLKKRNVNIFGILKKKFHVRCVEVNRRITTLYSARKGVKLPTRVLFNENGSAICSEYKMSDKAARYTSYLDIPHSSSIDHDDVDSVLLFDITKNGYVHVDESCAIFSENLKDSLGYLSTIFFTRFAEKNKGLPIETIDGNLSLSLLSEMTRKKPSDLVYRRYVTSLSAVTNPTNYYLGHTLSEERLATRSVQFRKSYRHVINRPCMKLLVTFDTSEDFRSKEELSLIGSANPITVCGKHRDRYFFAIYGSFSLSNKNVPMARSLIVYFFRNEQELKSFNENQKFVYGTDETDGYTLVTITDDTFGTKEIGMKQELLPSKLSIESFVSFFQKTMKHSKKYLSLDDRNVDDPRIPVPSFEEYKSVREISEFHDVLTKSTVMPANCDHYTVL